MELEKSFKNKRVLVTGISGFIGSHLAVSLQNCGATVIGTSRTVSEKHIVKIDINNKKKLEQLFETQKFDMCFHLGGEALVERGQSNPYATFRDNIVGTLNIIELSRLYSLERIVIASTAHVYGKNKVPYYEGYTSRPTRPYETSKAAVDMIATSYASSFDLPILIPRFVNIYGPGDTNFTRIIPKTIKGIIDNKSVDIWFGNTTRDFLYISDAIDAYLRLGSVDINKIGSNRIFNFGTGMPITAREVVEKIIQISGEEVIINKISDKRENEITKQYLSWSKASKILGWSPKVKLYEGLDATFKWYKNNL